jgi:YfiH family protein
VSARQTPASPRSELLAIDTMLAQGGLRSGRRAKRATQQPTEPRSASAPSRPAKRRQRPAVLRIPAWEAYPWLAHGFSTRPGGLTTAYRPGGGCGDLNLGLTPADAPEIVRKNREIFLEAVLSGSPSLKKQARLVLLRQIHSGLVHRVSAPDRALSRLDTPGFLRGDGLIADEPGIVLGIQTADCLPILVVDVKKRVVAAFHAGWRGTLARIVERGVGRMRAEFGCQPADLQAAVGPGIGGCCYSVGEEVRHEFSSQFSYADSLFQEVFDLDPVKQKYPMLFLTARAPGHSNLGPSIHLNLPEANRRQLLDAGIPPDNIHMTGLCTACDTERFFSHRAEQGFTGRMLGAIGVR